MRRKLFVIIFFIGMSIFSQDRKSYFPIWTFHKINADVYGVSVGVFPKVIFKDTTLTRSYGIRLEAPGAGIFLPLAPTSPLKGGFTEETLTEKVYGVNISGGSVGDIAIDGVSGAFIGQYLQRLNGVGISLVGNIVEVKRGVLLSLLSNDISDGAGTSLSIFGNGADYYFGLQIGGFNSIQQYGKGIQIGLDNSSNKFRGIQIGLLNKSRNHRGIQIGLWNRNEKRSLPLINWQFKG